MHAYVRAVADHGMEDQLSNLEKNWLGVGRPHNQRDDAGIVEEWKIFKAVAMNKT